MQEFPHFQQLDPPLHLVDMLGSHRHYPVQLDHLYSYFMSSDDESQRLKLLESFVRGCLEVRGIVQFTRSLNLNLGIYTYYFKVRGA